MKVKDMIRELKKLPAGYDMEISRVMSIDIIEGSAYEVILDFPIIGLCVHEESRGVRMLIEAHKANAALGDVRKIEP